MMKNIAKKIKNFILRHRFGLSLGAFTGSTLGLFCMFIIYNENYNNGISDFSLNVLVDLGGAYLLGLTSQIFICLILIDEDFTHNN